MFTVSTQDEDISFSGPDLTQCIEEVLNEDHPTPSEMRRRVKGLHLHEGGPTRQPLNHKLQVRTHWVLHILDNAPPLLPGRLIYFKDIDDNIATMEFEPASWYTVAQHTKYLLETNHLEHWDIDFAIGEKLPPDPEWKPIDAGLTISAEYSVVLGNPLPREIAQESSPNCTPPGRDYFLTAEQGADRVIDEWFNRHPAFKSWRKHKPDLVVSLQQLIARAIREAYLLGHQHR